MNFPTVCSSDLPYPEIVGASKDMMTVRVIRNLYCSRKSETTAVLQYMFQHFVSDKYGAEFALTFKKIGEVEMHHVDMLGEAMVAFGGDPTFFDTYDTPLSGRWMNYSRNLFQMLTADLEDEMRAISDYKTAATKVTNESLKKLFLRIALDEELHATILEGLLAQTEFWRKS